MDGSGFPKKLTGDDVDPMVLVVGAANAYDRFTTFQGLNPKGALKALLIDKVGAYPLKDLQTLQNILKSQKNCLVLKWTKVLTRLVQALS
jgi:HD-GYP domain-containing protein (c-di-GMP phosphodiesterase class II)